MICLRFWSQRGRGTQTQVSTTQTASTSSAAGSSRRILRAQNLVNERCCVLAASRIRWEVIKNPEITKKTSTPT